MGNHQVRTAEIAQQIEIVGAVAKETSHRVQSIKTLAAWCGRSASRAPVSSAVMSSSSVDRWAAVVRRALEEGHSTDAAALITAMAELWFVACSAYDVGGVNVMHFAIVNASRGDADSRVACLQLLEHILQSGQSKALQVAVDTDDVGNCLRAVLDAGNVSPRELLCIMNMLLAISQVGPSGSRQVVQWNMTRTVIDATCNESCYHQTQRQALKTLVSLCQWNEVLDLLHNQKLLRVISSRCHESCRMPLALVYAQCSVYTAAFLPQEPEVCLRHLVDLLHSGFSDYVMTSAWALSKYTRFEEFRRAFAHDPSFPALLSLSRRVNEVRLWMSVSVVIANMVGGRAEDKELCLRLGCVTVLIELMDCCISKVSTAAEYVILNDATNTNALKVDDKERMRTWTLALGSLSLLLEAFVSACIEFMDHRGHEHFPSLLRADENPEGQQHAANIIAHLVRQHADNVQDYVDSVGPQLVRVLGSTTVTEVRLACARALYELCRAEGGHKIGPVMVVQNNGVGVCINLLVRSHGPELEEALLDVLGRTTVLPAAVAQCLDHPRFVALLRRMMVRKDLLEEGMRLLSNMIATASTNESVIPMLLDVDDLVDYTAYALTQHVPVAAVVIATWTVDPDAASVFARQRFVVPTLVSIIASGRPTLLRHSVQALGNILLVGGDHVAALSHDDAMWRVLFEEVGGSNLGTRVHALRCIAGLCRFPVPEEHISKFEAIVSIASLPTTATSKTVLSRALDVVSVFAKHQSEETTQALVSMGIIDTLLQIVTCKDGDNATQAASCLSNFLDKCQVPLSCFSQDVMAGIWSLSLSASSSWEFVEALLDALTHVRTVAPHLVEIESHSHRLIQLVDEHDRVEVRRAAMRLTVCDPEAILSLPDTIATLCRCISNASDMCLELARINQNITTVREQALQQVRGDRAAVEALQMNQKQREVAHELARYAADALVFVLQSNALEVDIRADKAEEILRECSNGWDTLLAVYSLSKNLSRECEISVSRLILLIAVDTTPKIFVGSGGVGVAVAALTSPVRELHAMGAAALQASCRVDFFAREVLRESGMQVLLNMVSEWRQFDQERRVLTDVIIVLSVLCHTEAEIAFMFVSKGHLAHVLELQKDAIETVGTNNDALHHAVTRILSSLFTHHDLAIPLSTKHEAIGGLLSYLTLSSTRVVRSSAIILTELCARDDSVVEAMVVAPQLPCVMDAVEQSDPLCAREGVRILTCLSRKMETRIGLRSRLSAALPVIVTTLCDEALSPSLVGVCLEYLALHVGEVLARKQMLPLRPHYGRLLAQTSTIEDRVHVLTLVKHSMGVEPWDKADIASLTVKILAMIQAEHYALLTLVFDVLLSVASGDHASVLAVASLVPRYLSVVAAKPELRESGLATLVHLVRFETIATAVVEVADEHFTAILSYAADSNPESLTAAAHALFLMNVMVQHATRAPARRLQKLIERFVATFQHAARQTTRCALSLRGVLLSLSDAINVLPRAQAEALCKDVLAALKPIVNSKPPTGSKQPVQGDGPAFDSAGLKRVILNADDDALWDALPVYSPSLSGQGLRRLEWDCAVQIVIALAPHMLVVPVLSFDHVLSLFVDHPNDIWVHVYAAKLLCVFSRVRQQHDVIVGHKSVSLIPALLTHRTPGVVHSAAFALAQLADNVRTHRKLVQLLSVDAVCAVATAVLDEDDSPFCRGILYQLGRYLCNVSGGVHFQQSLDRGGRVGIARVVSALELHSKFSECWDIATAWQAALVDPSTIPHGIVNEADNTVNDLPIETVVDVLIAARTSRTVHSLEATTQALCVYARVDTRRVMTTLKEKCESPSQVLMWHLHNPLCTLNILWAIFYLCAMDIAFGEAMAGDDVMPIVDAARESTARSVKNIACKVLVLIWNSPKAVGLFHRARRGLPSVPDPPNFLMQKV